MIGKKIMDLNSIMLLQRNNIKSIWHSNLGCHLPVAVFINWQFIKVVQAVNQGYIFEYIPKKKSTKTFKEILNYPKIPSECYKTKKSLPKDYVITKNIIIDDNN